MKEYVVKTKFGYLMAITVNGVHFSTCKDEALSGDFESMDCFLQFLELNFQSLETEIFLK